MTRFLSAALVAAAATLTINTASAATPYSIADHAPAAACAPVTVLETRGDYARVTLGETYGWIRIADIEAARCDDTPEIALDARYVPREAAMTAYA